MGLQEFLENYWNAHEESKGDAGHTSRAGCPCPTHECTRLAGEQRNAGAGLLSRRLLWTREVPGPFLGSRISFAASCKLSLRSESMTASISSASACAEAERSGAAAAERQLFVCLSLQARACRESGEAFRLSPDATRQRFARRRSRVRFLIAGLRLPVGLKHNRHNRLKLRGSQRL